MAELLHVKGLHAGYGPVAVLHGVDLCVKEGEMVALIGSNGAGKSTLMRALSGLADTTGGSVLLAGQPVHNLPAGQRVSQGLIHVPEGRRLFRSMTVQDNLLMGAYRLPQGAAVREGLQAVYELFPRLRERAHQDATTMSGGEQQMCAIGRGLMSAPKLLMIDELSLGLSPLLVEQLVAALRALNAEGMSILLVEQDVTIALDLCHAAFVLDMGRIVRSGTGAALLADPIIRDAYLGVLED